MFEVIVIGAGWCGLVAAKTYLQAQPSAKILIVDGDSTLGGTWSKDRLYPHLVAEAQYGLFEYSDLPMDDQGIGEDGVIPGFCVHRYLTEYASKFDLLRRIQFNSVVETIQRPATGSPWILQIANGGVLRCDKLIVASGLTSEPYVPPIPNEGFCGQVLHSKELGNAETVQKIESADVKRVLVYGGSKSAFDAAYMLLRAGKIVDWAVRQGNGPSIMSPLKILGQPSFRLSNSRLLGMFSPTIFDTSSALHKVVHSHQNSCFMQPVVKAFWMTLTYLLEWPAQYWKSQNGRNLKPELGLKSLLWCPATLGVMTHPDLWERIHRGGTVTVHRKAVQSFSQSDVHFHDGTKAQVDMVILATGWKTMHSIFSPTDRLEIGLPSTTPFESKSQERWSALELEANKLVERTFPLLSESPEGEPKKTHESYRLYRHIVPAWSSDDRSLAFIGMLRTAGAPLVYEAQALWAVAYLTGKLSLPSKEAMEREIATTNSWIHKRYVCGRKVPFALFDFMPYIDMLYRDVGVDSRRKPNIIAEIFGLYTPRDFKGVVDEWLHSQSAGAAGGSRGERRSQGKFWSTAALLAIVVFSLCNFLITFVRIWTNVWRFACGV